MPFLATNLVQNMLNKLGQVEARFLFTATGGSATTFINTAWGDLEEPPDQDAFKNYLAIVVLDTAGASPEGKWSVCSTYVDTTYTGTIATVTDAIASGDTIMLAKQDKFPLQQILFAISKGLENLGDIPSNANTSLTTVAGQTEYSIPVAVKRGLKQVWIDDADNDPIQVFDTRNELTGAGTASILYTPELDADKTIRLIYEGTHSPVTAYNDTINEYIHPDVALCASMIELLQWYNRQDSNQGGDAFFLSLANEYEQRLGIALTKNPIMKSRHTPKYSIF